MKETEYTRDLRAYVLSRSDLPSLNPGKAMAQIHHSAVQMMEYFSRDYMVKQYIADGIANGANGFNTTIVLSATLDDIMNYVQNTKHLHGIVTDPSYPFLVENMEIASLIPQGTNIGEAKIIKVLSDGRVVMTRSEITCAWFLIDAGLYPDYFSSLELHP